MARRQMLSLIAVAACSLLICGALAAEVKTATSAKLGASSLPNATVNDRAHATLGQKNIYVANEGGVKLGNKTVPAGGASLSALQNRAQLARANGQQLAASTGSNTAAATNGKGANVSAQQQGDLRTVKTSSAKGAHDGDMKIVKDAAGDGQDITLGADRKASNQKLDVQAHGAKSTDSFDASNDKLSARVDPAAQTSTKGNGEISVQNKKKGTPEQFYLYEIGKQNGTGKGYNAQLQEKGDSVGRVKKTWLCTGTDVGASTCVDQNGNTVGKVLADSQGNTVVYNKKGMPIARGTAKKVANGRYAVTVNKDSNAAVGLFSGEVNNIGRSDCYQEVTGKRQTTKRQVEVQKVDFVYNSETNANGTKTISWPDCFDVVATIKLDAAIAIDSLAIEFLTTVKPLGTLSCMDEATCGRGCYYCHLCQQAASGKVTLLEQSSNDACKKTAASQYVMRATVCPPPEDTRMAMCSKFDHSLANKKYWATNNTMESKVLIWQRPQDEATLTQRYMDTVNLPANASALRVRAKDVFLKGIEVQYKLAHPELAFSSLTNEEKLQFYLRTYGKEQLLTCDKSVVNYKLGGDKVKSDWMLEAVKTGSDVKNDKLDIFSQQPCDQWVAVQNTEYQRQVNATAGKPNVLGSLVDALSG